MEGMPVRFYLYRYQDLWGAEVPVGWDASAIETLLIFSPAVGTGPLFTVTTFDREHWKKMCLKNLETPIRKSWSEMAEQYAFLPAEASERKPLTDREIWNDDLQEFWHSRNWTFRGEGLVVLILQTYKAKDKSVVYDSIVNRFVATLRFFGE